VLVWLDFFGVFVFAMSGALAADRRGMDLFGFVVIALLPAVGGGTVRDIILGVPVFWVQNTIYLWLILTAALLTFALARQIQRVERWLLWADAIGLAVFCVTGAAKALAVTGSAMIAVACCSRSPACRNPWRCGRAPPSASWFGRPPLSGAGRCRNARRPNSESLLPSVSVIGDHKPGTVHRTSATFSALCPVNHYNRRSRAWRGDSLWPM
jgi:hypothetical protein